MPRKSTTAKTTKATESKAAKTKTRTAKVEKVEKHEEEKLDVVEQARKELERLEAEARVNTTKKSFPWGVFCGAVVLTLAVVAIGWKLKEMWTVSRLQAKLPDIIEPLGGGMEVEKIGKPVNQSGVYSFTIKFADYDDEFTSYITRDAKTFFVDGYDVEEIINEMDTNSAESIALACEDLSKSERPQLDVYVSSECGYCKQAEVQMASAVEQIPALGEQIVLHYAGSIGSSGNVIGFLGSEEGGTENLRQVCIQTEQHDKFWPYIGCMAAGGESDTCLAENNVNTTALATCMEGSGLETITADINRANELAVSGTPSFFVNDEEAVSDVEFGGGQRIANAYKEIVCCASSEQPDFCTQTLD